MRTMGRRVVLLSFAGKPIHRLRVDGADLFSETEIEPPDPGPDPGDGAMPPAPDSSGWQVLNVPVNGGTFDLSSWGNGSGNVRLAWPDQAVTEPLTFKNVRNLHSIGGYMNAGNVSTTVVNGRSSGDKWLFLIQNPHSYANVYIEGLHANARAKIIDIFRYQHDATVVRTGHWNWTFVNCRFDGPAYADELHGDILQLNTSNAGPSPRFAFYNVTNIVRGQGMIISNRVSINQAVLDNRGLLRLLKINSRHDPTVPPAEIQANYPGVNWTYKDPTRMGFHVLTTGGGTNGNKWYPVEIDTCYFDTSKIGLLNGWAEGGRWTATAFGVKGPGNPTIAGNGTMSWPNNGDVEYTGVVRPGFPPGGDFAPASLLAPTKIYDRADWR